MAPKDKATSTKDDDFSPSKTVEEVAANLEQPDKFAKIFCKAADSQKDIDIVLKKNIKELIKNDKETHDFLKEVLREVQKEDWKYFISKVGSAGWAVILLVGGALFQGLFRKFFP